MNDTLIDDRFIWARQKSDKNVVFFKLLNCSSSFNQLFLDDSISISALEAKNLIKRHYKIVHSDDIALFIDVDKPDGSGPDFLKIASKAPLENNVLIPIDSRVYVKRVPGCPRVKRSIIRDTGQQKQQESIVRGIPTSHRKTFFASK